jgi:hypothetical protein
MKEIASALVRAQKAFGPTLKTATNPHFRSKYADLAACIESVIDALNGNGIALLQPTHECSDGVIIETVFLHESGEMISSGKLHVPASKQDPQGYGSALTYARRYSLMAACGIAPEDDDGNSASNRTSGNTNPAPSIAPPRPIPKSTVQPVSEPPPAVPPKAIGATEHQWQLKVTHSPAGSAQSAIDDWAVVVTEATTFALNAAIALDDVLGIFRVNRPIYDKLQQLDPTSYDLLMDNFKKAKAKFPKLEAA